MTEAGWYADPEGHGRGRRYWDGSQWTEHYEHPAAAEAAPAQQPAVQQQAPAQLPPAGWKDDPDGGPGMRYWDGKEWTDHYHPPRDGAGTAEQPAAGGFEPASQAFQPATGSEPAVAAPAAAAAAAASPGSLDETQLDVRGGYQAGQEEPAAEAPAEPAPSEPDAAPAAADGDAAGAADVSARLGAIEDQLAALSEKAGIPYNRPS
ncbi:MAG: DUF2510 domain-containing protein [Solirubrobacterales bacterium]